MTKKHLESVVGEGAVWIKTSKEAARHNRRTKRDGIFDRRGRSSESVGSSSQRRLRRGSDKALARTGVVRKPQERGADIVTRSAKKCSIRRVWGGMKARPRLLLLQQVFVPKEMGLWMSHNEYVCMLMVPATTSAAAFMVRKNIASKGVKVRMRDQRCVDIETD